MNALSLIYKESLAIIRSFTVTQPFCLIGGNESPNANDESAPAVLLIPGYMCSKGCFNDIYTALILSGFRVFLHEPEFYTRSIKEHSQSLKRRLRQIKKDFKVNNLFIIGYSMGGLISRNAMHNKWDNEFSFVSHLYTIATPNNGTPMSRFGIGDCTNEMTPKSEFINELNEKDYKFRNRITCYSAALDGIIISDRNAYLSGSRSFRINDVGHMSIIDDPSFHTHIISDMLQQHIKINNLDH